MLQNCFSINESWIWNFHTNYSHVLFVFFRLTFVMGAYPCLSCKDLTKLKSRQWSNPLLVWGNYLNLHSQLCSCCCGILTIDVDHPYFDLLNCVVLNCVFPITMTPCFFINGAKHEKVRIPITPLYLSIIMEYVTSFQNASLFWNGKLVNFL